MTSKTALLQLGCAVSAKDEKCAANKFVAGCVLVVYVDSYPYEVAVNRFKCCTVRVVKLNQASVFEAPVNMTNVVSASRAC